MNQTAWSNEWWMMLAVFMVVVCPQIARLILAVWKTAHSSSFNKLMDWFIKKGW